MKSILDFGAKGNGVDDDTDAIQAAIDAGGAEFPALTFKFTKQLNIGHACRLIGFNAKLRAPKFIQNAIVFNGSEGVVLDGFTIQAVTHTLLSNTSSCIGIHINKCLLIGTFPTTNYLINFQHGKRIDIEKCYGRDTQYGFVFGTEVHDSYMKYCEIQSWLQYAFYCQIGSYGIWNIELANNTTAGPLIGKGAKQSLVILGDPNHDNKKAENIIVLNNICKGIRKPWDKNALDSGSGDQIVLHHCKNFQLIGNESYGGGENGITVTRQCSDGIITHNSCWENDAHGMQVSGQNDRCSNIIIAQNHLYNNGLRKDGKGDVMSQLYCQDADDLLIDGNLLEDRFDKRQCKNGVQLALCKGVKVTTSNQYNWKDEIGFMPWIHYRERFV